MGHLRIKRPSFRSRSQVTRGYFKASDGSPLYFESVGKGPPVVFCYGLACNMRSFRFQRSWLKRHYQCIFWDYRGHEKSAHVLPSREDGVQILAKDLKALVDHLGVQQVSLVGHSYGVNVAFTFALQYQAAVSAMVWVNGLLDTPLFTMFRRPYAHYVFHTLKQIYDRYPSLFESGWQAILTNPLVSYLSIAPLGFNLLYAKNRDIQNYIEGVGQVSHITFMELMSELYKLKDTSKVRKLKKVPVLLCGGLADNVTPVELQMQLATRIPKGTFKGIPEGSHNVHLERPRVVNGHIHSWLKHHVS